MYRVNPFTYLVDGILASTLGAAPVTCARNEYLTFKPPANQSCEAYMQPYIDRSGGYLLARNAQGCEYCPIGSTDDFLQGIGVDFGRRWRNFGLLWAYIVFNLAMTMVLYWAFRVPRKAKAKTEEKK